MTFMHGSELAAREGVTLSRHHRATALLVLFVAAAFGCMVFQTQDRAYAFATPTIPPPPTIPGLLFTGGAGEGVPAAVTVGEGVVAAPAFASAAVLSGAIIGGIALGYGIDKTVSFLWHWGKSHSPSFADAPDPTHPYPGVKFQDASVASAGPPTLTSGYYDFPVTMQSRPPIADEGFAVYKTDGTICTRSSFGSNVYGATSTWHQSSALCVNQLDYVIGPQSVLNANNTYAGAVAGGVHWIYETNYVAGPSGASGTNVVTTTPVSRCQAPTGGTVTEVTGTAVTYTGATPDASLPPIVNPACPAGTVRVGARYPTTAPGVSNVPQPFADWGPTMPSAFADCQTPGSCTLVLYRVGHGTTAVPVACNDTALCAGWMTNTTRSGATTRTVKRTSDGTDVSERPRTWPNGDTLDCYWGPYLVEVDNCSTVATEPTTTPVDKPVPGGAGSPAAGADGSSCFPTGWAMFNPLEWVYKPVKCVLIWAFEPSQANLDAASARVSAAWGGTAPAVVSTAVGTVVAPVVALQNDTGPSSCDGPAFVIPQLPAMHHSLTLHPLSTCNQLTQYLLGIYLPIATALIYLGGFFGGTRSLLRAFNMEGDL